MEQKDIEQDAIIAELKAEQEASDARQIALQAQLDALSALVVEPEPEEEQPVPCPNCNPTVICPICEGPVTDEQSKLRAISGQINYLPMKKIEPEHDHHHGEAF